MSESIYDHPTLYDVLFSGHCRPELELLLACPERYELPTNGNHYRYFEPACGTGRLLWRLGKAGHEVVGLDINSKAIAFCNKRLRRHGLAESAIIGDMTDFSLTHLRQDRPFDVAFNFVSSFLHLTTDAAALKHLNAVANVLKPGGCYLLGLHLQPRRPPHDETRCEQEKWSVRHGNLAVRSQLSRIAVDRRKMVETVEFRLEATTPTRHYQVIDRFPLRMWSATRFHRLLARSGRFQTLDTFDYHFDLDLPIHVDTQTEDVVYVLRKTPE